MGTTSIVIPTYNEAENIPIMIGKIEQTLPKDVCDFIVIVDDNSPDKTAEIAEGLNKQYGNIIVHKRPCKLGIGDAVKDGLKTALSLTDSSFIVTLDADFTHDPTNIPCLLNAAKDADLVLGSRYVKGGKIIEWTFSRKIISLSANRLCRLLLKTGLNEHTTNFRVYSRECAKAIVNYARSKRFEWFIETILIARDNNFRIKEVPVASANRVRGKTKFNIINLLVWGVYVSRTFVERSAKRSRFSISGKIH